MAKTGIPCGGCDRPGCRLCHLYRTDARYRRKWSPGTPSGVRPDPTSPAASCVYRGDDLTGVEKVRLSLPPLRSYAPCEHPARPLGAYVCPCQGCGPKCRGYSPEPDDEADPTAPTVAQTHSLQETTRPMTPLTWSYGVTTVPSRRDDLLPRTLASLKRAGFDAPRLFVDGADGGAGLSYEREFGLPVTARWPLSRAHNNWYLALTELYVREPRADRYAIFQDDVVAVRNLRSYLDGAPYRANTYLNLYTFPENAAVVPSGAADGFHPSNQKGKGALGLVFDSVACRTLLMSEHMLRRPESPPRGWEAIDGGVVDSLRKAGYKEVCHRPSLLDHTGEVSSLGHKAYPSGVGFPGEDFDATTWLPPQRTPSPAGVAERDEEVARLKDAVKQDVIRMQAANSQRERQALAGHVERYKSELRRLGVTV